MTRQPGESTHDADPALGAFLQSAASAEAIQLGGEVNRILAGGDRTGERLAVVVHEARRGWSPPWHRQPLDDETFYVLEGTLTFWAEHPDAPWERAVAGTLVFLPRGVPHAFRVESETARWLTISTPAGHERFYREAGEAAVAGPLPEPDSPMDIARLAAAANTRSVEVLGPPPQP